MRRLDGRSRAGGWRNRGRSRRGRAAGKNRGHRGKSHGQIFETVAREEMRRIRHIGLVIFISLAQLARADFSEELAQAASPLNEGVPEVAIVRLKALLARNPPEAEWRTAAEKLGQAEIA